MLTTRIIPCLDVKDGRVVKGVRFGNLTDSGSPLELALAYQEQGADELVVLDIAATPSARAHRLDVVRSIRSRLSIPLTVGGGIRTLADAGGLLAAGADKVAVNSAAVERPGLLTEIADRYGRQCTVLALDAARRREGWEVLTRSGQSRTGRDALKWAAEAEVSGAGEILLTSWDQDGSGDGYDLALLRAISEAVTVPIIASGGAASPDDMRSALEAGADAVLAASIFHYGKYTVREVKTSLARSGIEVRL